SASVGAARSGGQRRQADVLGAAPVAGYLSEREEPDLASVWRAAETVDPGAAHHGDSPPAFGAGPQERERVVVHHESVAPAHLLDSVAKRGPLLGLVRTCEQGVGGRCERALAPVEPRAGDGALEQVLEHVDTAFTPKIVG